MYECNILQSIASMLVNAKSNSDSLPLNTSLKTKQTMSDRVCQYRISVRNK